MKAVDAFGPGLKRAARPAIQAAMRCFIFYPSPKVLVNSLPKSGTHLLANLMGRLPRMINSHLHFNSSHVIAMTQRDFPLCGDLPPVKRELCLKNLGRARNGQFVTAHLPVIPGLSNILKDSGYRHVLILRDPRDVLVSHVHFIMKEKTAGQIYRYFSQELTSFDSRLMAMIRGIYDNPDCPNILPISTKLDHFGAWRDRADVLECRYERLIGPKGGGSAEQQLAEIQRIASYVDRPILLEDAQRIATKVWSTKSRTFRNGIIGDWRDGFSEAHKDAFKEVAGDRLITWGYETDDNW